jgi:hypothetical protein
MKFTDDYGDLKIGDIIYIKGKCGKSWVKYKGQVKRFVNKKYIVPMYLKTIGCYDEPRSNEVIFPTPYYTYRWKKAVENYDE